MAPPACQATNPVIGVLALQGDFDAHRRRLEELGASVTLARTASHLAALDALVIPGGESTALICLLGDAGLTSLERFARSKPTFGTCAGAILLAAEVEPPQSSIRAIDMAIRRNAYGRQMQSSIRDGRVGSVLMEMVFIRAPRIVRVGPQVEVIATLEGQPVAVRQGKAIAATFHPELSDDTLMHRMFLDLVRDSQTTHSNEQA
jgi:5'-phosphate synthase pdxT subunit